jgi:hypothetical protein
MDGWMDGRTDGQTDRQIYRETFNYDEIHNVFFDGVHIATGITAEYSDLCLSCSDCILMYYQDGNKYHFSYVVIFFIFL